MQKYPTLKKAPLREALIDFRFQLPSDFDIKKFESIQFKYKKEYPHIEPLIETVGQFKFGPAGLESNGVVPNKMFGYRFKGKEGSDYVQFRVNGFTYNRLRPYKDWDYLIDKTKLFWNEFKALLPVSGVINRLATRYINSIKMTAESPRLDEYVNNAPYLPQSLDSEIVGLLHTTAVRKSSKNLMGNIGLTIEKAKEDAQRSIILDIDVYSEEIIEMDSDKIWERLECLRELKNDIFFSFVNPKKIEEYL